MANTVPTATDENARDQVGREAVPGSIVRVFVAGVLLAAAGLKVHQAMTDSLGAGWILSGRTVLVLEIQFEIVLGLWLLSGLHRRLSWATAVGCFGLFACVSFYKGASGASSCGCFGKITVPPWVTLILDVMILFALVSCRPQLKRPATVRFNRLRWAGFVAGALGLGPAAAVAGLFYGPARLVEPGQILGDQRYVVLEIEAWPGKGCPLFDHIDIPESLAEGAWRVVLYRHDCPHCQKEVGGLGKPSDGNQPARTAFIELPPYASSRPDFLPTGEHLAFGRLSDGRDWIVETPAVLDLRDGIVSDGSQREASAEPIATAKANGSKDAAAPKDPNASKVKLPANSPVVAATASGASHDFGFVKSGVTRDVVFRLANPSGNAIALRKIVSECKCMLAIDPPKSVPAGGSADVRVRFIAPKKPINYSKRVVLVPTGKADPIGLRVIARVGLPLKGNSRVLEIGTLSAGETREVPMEIFNDGESAIRPIYGTSTLSGCIPKVPRAAIPAGGKLAIPLAVTASGAPGTVRKGTVRIQTNCPTQSAISRQVRYTIAPAGSGPQAAVEPRKEAS